ncbi:hypothetical protein BV375_12580 [Nostoc sp. 106C]|nr:hypothetical protein BV375_12580 [Nostoc sp. 106C]
MKRAKRVEREGKAGGCVSFLSSVGGKRVIERRGKCKKKFKFLSVTSHCEPLFSNQTSMLDWQNLQSFS